MKKSSILIVAAFAVSVLVLLPAIIVAQQQEAGPSNQPVRHYYADTMIGKAILSSDGAVLGEVENLVLSSDGKVMLQLSRGGVFDIAERYMMIPWQFVDNVTRTNVLLTLSASDIQNAPMWRSETLGPGWSDEVNAYFGEEGRVAPRPSAEEEQREYYGEEDVQRFRPSPDIGVQDELTRGRAWWR
ncbi:MAG: PRC-barrel domain containing protein [Candidatus Abyssobacteria bacterium SURF_5]|uniref:PRC-barrel domain containing protein n=1 Tax=Abyssobacteria bacterium (strain SURF_5) TaxID=2093360 RepID=A0A3A4NRV1_ABYX5|nr:MAG: PRC-barrel domain containing protein [Candidatus Abyssubacteria bacterium SURF_5]